MTAISEYNQKQCQLWSSDQGLPQAKRTYSLIGLQVWTWKGKLPPSDQKIVLLLRRTQFWHKLWYHLRVFLGWIKTKGPTLDDLKTRVWTHQTLTSPPVRQILKELKTVDAKDTEAAAEVCLKSLEASETQIAQEQSKLLKQRLESEWGVAKTAEILTNPLLVPELHTQPPLVMAKGRIDQICIIVRNYFHNTGTLQKLKSELEQTVGAPITAQVMTKLNYQSYLNGLALITPETAEGVRQLAKDLQASADADAMLHKIETTCRTWLPGDEIIIKSISILTKPLQSFLWKSSA